VTAAGCIRQCPLVFEPNTEDDSLHEPALARVGDLLRLLLRHELRAGERGEAAVFGDEFVKPALLDDLAGIENEDAVGVRLKPGIWADDAG
jgi:hypothetical protein